MSERAGVLIVDDEEDFREVVVDYLEMHGFEVHEAGNGDAMRELLGREKVDAVLLDLRLPGEDGFQLCRWLRDNSDVGILMLTGSSEQVDKIVGLEMGADDFIAKTAELRELLARIKSVLRRVAPAGPQTVPPAATAMAAAPKPDREASEIPFGAGRLNANSRTLSDAEGAVVPLSAMEFDLLKAFADHPNRVLTRDQLLELAHKRDWEPFDRSIDVRIARLRKKVETDPTRPRYIRTIRGVGYLYAPNGEE